MMNWKRFSVIASIVFSCCLPAFVLCDKVYLDGVEMKFKVQTDTNIKDEGSRIRKAISGDDTHQELCRTSSQCTGNQTLFDPSTYYKCYCDNACHQTFKDCCPDFVKTCGPQQETREKSKTSWKCFELDLALRRNCYLYGPTGIWMVWNCSESWPTDETRAKCENASEKFSYPIEDFLPVVGKNGFTFRNKHCAVCNGIKNYITWEIVIQGFITPPRDYSIDEKLQFALANGGYIERIGPGEEQPRRYCAGIRYKDTCSNKTHPDYDKCKKGPVETVSKIPYRYYKNEYCALCNGESKGTNNIWGRSLAVCLNPTTGELPEGFSIVFRKDTNTKIEFQVKKENCPQGLVYDDNLEYCREGVVTIAEDILSDLFLVALWFEARALPTPPLDPFTFRTLGPLPNINNITAHLKSALIKNFVLKSNQITAVKLHRQNDQSTFLVATFHLQLTPYQEFILANQKNASHLNISTTSQKFLELLKFTTNFTLKSGIYRFSVVKLVSRQLACFQGRMLQPHEYEVDTISGNIFDNTSGTVFSRNKYTFLGKIGGNITICGKLVLSGCHDGAFVTLNKSEYFIHQNLTIFHYGTNKSFSLGDYQIIEDSSSIHQSGLSSFQNTSLPENSTIAICLPFGGIFNTTKEVTKLETTETSYALKILTLAGFTISILFLLFLLITYGIFKELRTLPGLNLMSLAISMLLSHLIWLTGTAFFQDTKTCQVLGIIEHYLFLVAFMAMSVISYHSCVVFSRPFGVSRNSLAKFAKYSVIVWLTPAIFIAVCISLDQTKAIFDIYDNSCWLSTDKAVLYLFLLPAAVLLLFNICTFIKTALALSCNKEDSHLLNKDRKQNLIVCIKLATLVGFPWLFAFLGVFFPDIEVFQYLFVIFACFQGFYVAVAFVCNKKTLRLYKKLRKDDGGTAPAPRNQIFEMS